MGIFFECGPVLFENGISIIPLTGKRPVIQNWQEFCKRHPTEPEFSDWLKRFPNHNVGILGGPANGIRWLDIDAYTDEYCTKFLELLPPILLKRVGKKGFVIPVKEAGQKRNKFHYRGIEMGDFLGEGRQIAAIGIHPDTGKPYQWSGPESILDMSLNELFEAAIDLSDNDLARIEGELNKIDFVLDPRDEEKKKIGGTVGAGGRNDKLKSICGAMFERGCKSDEVAREIFIYDQNHHRPPLFSDAPEFSGDPEINALKFATSIFQTFLREKASRGEAILQISQNPAVDLAKSRNGVAKVNMLNVTKILAVIPNICDALWFDEFYQRIRTKQNGVIREWIDMDDIEVQHFIQEQYRLDVSLKTVQGGVEWYANNNKKNEPKDWMESLSWDGCRRLEHFFVDCLGATEDEHVKAASKNWWIAMVARVYRPGCKFDNMVVLEGEQGKFKSSALELIAGQWFSASNESIETKDFLQSLSGKLIIEIAELDSFSRANIKGIKRVLSTRVDTYRPSYGRRAQDFRRQCVFVGTTNEDQYLEDATGGRRFWPIQTGDIDLDLIAQHRDQLFAEAVFRFKANETWWIMPRLTLDIQEGRRRHDSWEHSLAEYLTKNDAKDHFRSGELALGALQIDPGDFDKAKQMRLAAAMKSLNWKNVNKTHGGIKARWWVENVKENLELVT